MSRLNDTLCKGSLNSILSYLICDTNENRAASEQEEQELEASYGAFIEKLQELYPDAGFQEDELLRAVSDFAAIHDRAYFRTGVLAGFRLHRELEEGYERQSQREIPAAVRQYGLCAEERSRRKQSDSLLEQYFAARIDTALEEELRGNARYQDARDRSRREVCSIDELGLEQGQWETVDQALSASNHLGAEYGRAAYMLGFQDAMDIVVEIQGVSRSVYAMGAKA
ncbi:MAG: hypothetical protein K2N01_09485 [Lachnospiraceae bacterium]|nr:hypothetical protein [Lachnospiraceae bacterium]